MLVMLVTRDMSVIFVGIKTEATPDSSIKCHFQCLQDFNRSIRPGLSRTWEPIRDPGQGHLLSVRNPVLDPLSQG